MTKDDKTDREARAEELERLNGAAAALRRYRELQHEEIERKQCLH
jgi:hypothetical protein